MTRLTITDLGVNAGNKRIIDGLSFEAGSGEFIGLIGPNGAGKTTLLRAILGLVGFAGRIELDGRAVKAMSPAQRAARIAYLPQEREVAWPVCVRELVAIGRRASKSGLAGLSKADEAAIDHALAAMNLIPLADRIVQQLSGGERARALIARVLVQDTDVILADEPVAGLDPAHQLDLMQCLAGLAAGGRTIIASFHELGLAASFCTRLLLVQQGQILADGLPEAVMTADQLSRAFGIEAHILRLDGQLIVQPKLRRP